jgi:hypothetical protein
MYDKGQQVILLKAMECPPGEMYQFNYEREMQQFLKTFGLDTVAQISHIEVFITLDGAKLCDKVT